MYVYDNVVVGDSKRLCEKLVFSHDETGPGVTFFYHQEFLRTSRDFCLFTNKTVLLFLISSCHVTHLFLDYR